MPLIMSQKFLKFFSPSIKTQQNVCCLQHFSSCLLRLSNHVTHVTIICVTKFKTEFQKYKARKCNTLYQRKRVKGQYFWKTSFWLHKLVIRTHFKNQIQYGTCVTCKICLISTKHCLI